jgi:hypothetical protein
MLLSDILVMPKPSESDFFWFLFFATLMVVSYFVINLLYKKQKYSSKNNVFSYAFIIGRGFSKEESGHIQKFIEKLSDQERNILLETKNWKLLRKQLNNFLLNHKSIKPDIAVQIFDKLMLDKVPKEPFTIHSIQVGEIVAIITEYGEQLVRVMKTADQDLLLAAQKLQLPENSKNILGKIYLYRNNEGGFFIPGEIIGTFENAVLFHIIGEPVSAGHAHLMLNVKFQLELSNWPKFQEKDENEFHKMIEHDHSDIHDQMSSIELEIKKRFNNLKNDQPNLQGLKKELKETKKNYHLKDDNKQNVSYVFIGTKLSDRGVIFEIKDDVDPNFWRISELWEIRFQIPGGIDVKTIGKIMPSKTNRTRFLIKFIEMSETERTAIYEDIKRLGGSRELLN